MPRKSRSLTLLLLPVLISALLLTAASHLAAQAGSTATTTTITSSGSLPDYTLSSTVSGAGASAPTGTVTFIDKSNGGITLGSASLAGSSSGSNNWTISTTLASLDGPGAAVSADFNGDGKADLAWVNYTAYGQLFGGVLVALGNGDGTFATPTLYTLVNTGSGIAAGNFGGGFGATDLAVGDGANVDFFTNDGQGNYSFNDVVSLPMPAGAIVVGPNSAWIAVTTSAGIVILTPEPSSGNSTWSIATTVTVDEGADALAVTGTGVAVGHCITTGVTLSGELSILTGTAPNFQVTQKLPVAGCVQGLAAGGFHGQSTDDLVATMAATASNNVQLFLNEGAGAYSAQAAFTGSADGEYGVVTGDFNGDGMTDFATADEGTVSIPAVVSIFYGKGNGAFSQPVNVSTGSVEGLTTGKFSGQGTDIVATSGVFGDNIYILQTSGGGVSSTATVDNILIPGTGFHQIYASYGGDSTYAASESATLGLFALPITTTLAVAANPASISVGQQTALSATLTPDGQDGLSTNAEAITFYNGATALGTASLTSGVATLNVNTLPTGTDSVSATYAGDTNFAGSLAPAITVNVSAASAPSAGVSTTSVTFGGTPVNTPSAPQTVTLSNAGAAALSITSITASGDFAETNTCSGSVAAAGSCTISITFTPTTSGSRSGTLTITDNASGSPQTVPLTGTGEGVGITSGSSTLSISSSGGSTTTTVTLSSQSGFSGTVNLACSVSYSGSGTSSNPPTCSMNPASASVSNGGSVSSTLTVNTPGASTAKSNMVLRNTGVALAGLFLLGLFPRRRKLGLWFCALLLIAASYGITGCGGGGSSSTTSSHQTTAGSYSVVVTATSGSVTSSATIALTVQ